ncbi:MAG: phosphatase PAP2 family protein [Polyangiaceae bacterium]|nr:phosphatase PAP2 family protein [Polyangiaceae bacterium]NUQ74448.1 phosphatase PAP2 family protein [Polyangiaceae bacterium]
MNGPRRAAVVISLALSGALALSSRPALALDDAAPNGPDWVFSDVGGEIVTAIVCAAPLSMALFPQTRSRWGAWRTWEADRFYGLLSDFTGAAIGSALTMTAGYIIEGRYYQLAGLSAPFTRSLRTSIIDVEAVALASGLSFGIKRIAGRCRPRAWKEGKCGDLDTDYDAFPSGHTTPVAALAGVRFVLAINSTGDRALRYAAFGVAEGMTLATAVLRVAAGAHSWEDVLAGWVLGTGTGVLLAYAHPMVDVSQERPFETSQPLAPMFTWAGSF